MGNADAAAKVSESIQAIGLVRNWILGPTVFVLIHVGDRWPGEMTAAAADHSCPQKDSDDDEGD